MSDAEAEHDIAGLLNRYGHIIDERHWDQLAQIFVPDLVFDASDFGSHIRTSLAQLRSDWEAIEHPLAHHATNIVIEFLGSDRARVDSKGICLRRDGSVFSAVYRDEVIRTADGWRISRRAALLRRAADGGTNPAGSGR
jgi:SnoaL-like domain